MSSQEIKDLENQRQQQDAEIQQHIAGQTSDPSPQSQPAAPVSLDPVSESEVKPEEAPVVTTSLAQNLDNDDLTPLSTEPSQKQPQEQTQQPQEQQLSQEASTQASPEKKNVLYAADGSIQLVD